MPRKYSRKNRRFRKKSRTFKRKQYRKRKYGYKIGRAIQPIARMAKLRYLESVTLTCSTGIIAHTVFRANSLYDPNFTGSGHQPHLYDQISALYHHVTCYGSKMTITASQQTSTPTAQVVGINLQAGSTSPAGWAWPNYVEAKQGQFRHLAATNQVKPARLSCNFSAKKWFNVKDVVDNQNLRGAVDANPAEEAFFDVWMQSHDQSSTSTIVLTVVIDYIAKFTEPKDIDNS